LKYQGLPCLHAGFKGRVIITSTLEYQGQFPCSNPLQTFFSYFPMRISGFAKAGKTPAGFGYLEF